jgi:hypothetical protein
VSLVIKKGGLLVKITSSEEDDEERDVTPLAITHLFTECSIEEGATLRDIFLLLKSNLTLFDAILGNWCKEIVCEGLQSSQSLESKESKIEYLELYWTLDQGDDYFSGHHFPRFHGVGFLLQEDLVGSHGEIYGEKGTRINYGLTTPLSEMIDLPVKLQHAATIYENYRVGRDVVGINYTLGHILQGIVWELSFFGDPSSREQNLAEIFEHLKVEV